MFTERETPVQHAQCWSIAGVCQHSDPLTLGSCFEAEKNNLLVTFLSNFGLRGREGAAEGSQLGGMSQEESIYLSICRDSSRFFL